MEFAYSPRLADLKERARALTDTIMQFEDECERNNGISDESHATIKAAVLASGLQAINTPVEYGGAGLTVLEQAVVQDELGKLTNALWDTVWRPGEPADPRDPRTAGALPDSRCPRRPSRRRRDLRGQRGLGLLRGEHHRDPRRQRRVHHQRREVVRHGR